MFYSPLKNSIFRSVWLVMFFSNVCTWAHTVTASILITKLTTSTVLISLIQTAAALPIFLLSIPSGVLADFFNRKKIIITAQAIMALIAFAMAFITFSGSMTPYLLIGTTFLLNAGLALNQPAWQATSSTLIPAADIKQAAALNNLSFNLSRSIGPAIAGYYFSKIGAGYLFLLNGISFLIAILVLNKKLVTSITTTQPTLSKLYQGSIEGFLLYKKFTQIKYIFLKAFLYFFCASSVWALLPYIVIIYNKMPDTNLGLLTGLMGIGAILNAYSIFYLRKKLSDNQLTTLALFLVSIVVYLVPHAHGFNTLAVIMLLFGYSWSIAISVFNGILQADFPAEVRSRIIGIYCVFFAGSQAISSYLSGILVHNFGLANSLLSISLFALLVCVAYLPELLPLIRLQKSKLSSN